MDLWANCPRWASIADRQLDSGQLVDLVKRIEAFPATECACEWFFCQLRDLVGDFRHQMRDSMITDLLVVKTKIRCPNGTHIKTHADVLRRACEMDADAGPYQMGI
jgi:hypothetical protein